MDKKLLFFNIVYYAITLLLFQAGRQNPSSSLGYGIFILVFWVFAAILLMILVTTKVIKSKSWLDKLGIFTATPALCLIAVGCILAINGTKLN